MLDWVPLESDYTDNRKIQKVRHKIGLEAQAVYTQLLCEISQKIDIDNDLNGYLETTGEGPVEYLSWRTGLEEEKLNEIIETFAETGLIKKEEWEENREIFIPQILEENRAGKYLDQQEAGREGGKKSRKGNKQAKEGKQNNPPYISLKGLGKGSVSGVQAERNTVHNSTLQYITKQNTDTKNTNPESGDSEEYDKESLKEEYGEKAIEFTDRMIRGVKRVNEKANPPEPGTSNYKDWVVAFDRLNRLGPCGGDSGYSWERLEEILTFAFQDNFWSSNVASPVQLRKKGDNGLSKVVNIENKMEGSKSNDDNDWEEAD